MIQQPQQGLDALQIVGHRIDSDYRVATRVRQAVDDAGGDAFRVIRRMIGLQARGKPPGEPQRVPEARDHPNLGGHRYQVLETHDFRDCCGHFRSQSGPERRQDLAGSVFAEQPVAKIANCKMRDGGERRGVVPIDD